MYEPDFIAIGAIMAAIIFSVGAIILLVNPLMGLTIVVGSLALFLTAYFAVK